MKTVRIKIIGTLMVSLLFKISFSQYLPEQSCSLSNKHAVNISDDNRDYGVRTYNQVVINLICYNPFSDRHSLDTNYGFSPVTSMTDYEHDGKQVFFIGGSAFDCNRVQKELTCGTLQRNSFSNALVLDFTNAIGDDFHIVTSSRYRFKSCYLNTIFAGRWAIINGAEVITPSDCRITRETSEEISSTYAAQGGVEDGIQTELPLFLIGSSYGSVVVAQAAIAIIEESNGIDRIDVLYLRASMIDHDSELWIRLDQLWKDNKILNIYWDPIIGDNITHASGLSKKDGKRNYRKILLNRPSIANQKKHPHTIAAKDPASAESLIQLVLHYNKAKD
ncbi:MAG: hypothetical protein R6V49_00900 [Bacteroidales bacterium]